MGFPNANQILAAASQYSAPANYMFAFAATQGRTPNSASDWQNFITTAGNEQRAVGTDISMLMGYATANGSFPLGNVAALQHWAIANGFMEVGGVVIAYPPPGYVYPPGGASVTPGLNVPTNTVPGPSQTMADVSALKQAGSSTITTAADWWRGHERTILLVGAVGGAFWFHIPQALLRSFGRR